jgi:hypothetical protein
MHQTIALQTSIRNRGTGTRVLAMDRRVQWPSRSAMLHATQPREKVRGVQVNNGVEYRPAPELDRRVTLFARAPATRVLAMDRRVQWPSRSAMLHATVSHLLLERSLYNVCRSRGCE